MNIRSGRAYPFDSIVMVYCLLMTSLILVFGRPLTEYLDELSFYVGTALLAFVLPRVLDERASRIQGFFRLLYPALLLWPFYTMTQGTIFLIFDRFFDSNLSAFEVSIFGFDPSLMFDSRGLNVIVTEILSLCYFSYYFMMPAFLLPVFLKRDYQVIKESLAAICLTFFISYVLFSLYPVEGPRWYLADQYQHTLEGPVFRQLVNFVIHTAAVHGGCMPSSHTGVALVILLYCFKFYRKAAWILLPFVIGLAAGTVWGRFHYVSDVVVGAGIGVAAFWFVRKNHDRWIDQGDGIVTSDMMQSAHVS